MDPSLPLDARARDRRRPRRRRRRNPRDRARQPRRRRPRRPLRPPRVHRLPRPLPELGGRRGGWSGSRTRPRSTRRSPRVSAPDSPAVQPGRWLRGQGLREPTGRRRRRRRRSTPSPATSRRRSSRRTTTRSGSTRLRSRGRAATSQVAVHGGVVERRRARRADRAAPRGVGLAVQGGPPRVLGRGVPRRDARGLKVASSRGVTAIHDKDGWLPSIPAALAGARTRRGAAAAGLAVDPARPARRLAAARPRLRPRQRPAATRLPEGLHGRHARLADRADDSTGPASRSPAARSSPTSSAAAARARLAGRASTRSATCANRNALDAFEETRDEWQPLGLRHRIEHAQCLRPEDVGAVRRARRRPPRCSSRTRPPTRSSPTGSGPTGSTAPTRSATCSTRGTGSINGSDAPIEELDPWGGIVAGVLRALAAGPAGDGRGGARARRPSRRPGRPYDERRRGKLLPGYLADLVVLDRDPLAIPAEELPEVQVVATMVGGRWTHNPPPW